MLASIFMVELEKTVVLSLPKIAFRLHYLDGIVFLIKDGSFRRILGTLNNFHTNQEYRYKKENNFMLSCLDVLIYLQCCLLLSFRKKSTLTDVDAHPFLISLTNYILKMELKHLKKVFSEINGFSNWVMQNVIKLVREKI